MHDVFLSLSEMREQIEPEKVYVFSGYTEKAGDNLKFRLEDAIPIENARDILTKFVSIRIDTEIHPLDVLKKIKNHPGK